MLLQWDKELLLLLNGSESLYVDGVMWTITKTITWVPMILVLLYILFRNRQPRNVFIILLFLGLVILICDQTASSICKPLFQRFRPTHDAELAPLVDVVNGYRGGLYGFFSSHAANTFGVAIFLSLLFRHKPTSFLLYAWAICSSYSRIYLGVHFPSDILCGMVFGTLTGLILYSLMTRLFYIMKERQPDFTSSAYTANGFVVADFQYFSLCFAFTLTYIAIRAIFYATQF